MCLFMSAINVVVIITVTLLIMVSLIRVSSRLPAPLALMSFPEKLLSLLLRLPRELYIVQRKLFLGIAQVYSLGRLNLLLDLSPLSLNKILHQVKVITYKYEACSILPEKLAIFNITYTHTSEILVMFLPF